MKKKISLLAFLTLFTVLLCTACSGSRKALTADEFSDKMSNKDFTVSDLTDQYEKGIVEAIEIAVGENYQLEFYVLPSEKQTNLAFSENKAAFEEAKGNSSSDKSVSVGNYQYYYQTSNGKFYLVSCIDNTMLYCVTDKEYSDEVKDLAKELGYL